MGKKSHKRKRIVTIDCETDPFLHGRVPEPFIWGVYDGETFESFRNTADFAAYLKEQDVFAYAHNGGKFDFLFLLPFVEDTKQALVVNGRIVSMPFGRATLRDSYAIIPMPLAAFEKDEFDYTKMEATNREKHMDEITDYLKSDCVSLYKIVTRFIEEAGSKPTIAGNAMAYSKKLGVDPGKTNHNFDNALRKFYFGGRCENFKVGEIPNVDIYDIKSQYPTAMSDFLPTGGHYIITKSMDGFERDEIQRGFIELTCYSAGAFPLRTKKGLTFPHAIDRYCITGWEYIAAKDLGLIKGENIHAFFRFENKITFKPYVDHWFAKKDQAEKNGNKENRLIAKILLNSLYGKLAQNPVDYKDKKICPRDTEVDYENGWRLTNECYGVEFHERPVLHRYEEKYGDEWVKFPIHYNVATAASITGHARAQLLRGIHSVGPENVAYCDTDSMFIDRDADTGGLRTDGKIGAWDYEGFCETAHFGGKKLYAAKITDGPKKGQVKKASKGACLSFDQIKRIAAGETIDYKRDAPTFSLVNGPVFLIRSISSTALVEPRHPNERAIL